jgi:radical SAM superfamily enzyme YgiQ (UPF0313 family)
MVPDEVRGNRGEPMRVALVRPNIGRLDEGPFDDDARMEPLAIELLAGMTPPDVELGLFDDRCGPIPYDEGWDLAGVSVETFTARRSYEIAAEFRARGVRVAMGGIHASLAEEEVASKADSVCVGDAEEVWPAMLADAAAGRLLPRYRGGQGSPQCGVRPVRGLVQGGRYLPIGLVQFGRGCPVGCEFCAVSAASGGGHRARPAAETAAEALEASMAASFRPPTAPLAQERARAAAASGGRAGRGGAPVFFVDDNLVADREAAKGLFRALAPLGLSWVSQASLDMLEDGELMELMVASGCLGHVIGFESLDERDLKAMGKRPNAGGGISRYARQVELLRSWGLQTWAAFTLGHDHDTVSSIRELLDFAIGSRFAFAAFNVLMPYPGTPLYARLSEEGRLLYDGAWWLHPTYRFNHAAFRPALMGPDELTAAGLECRRRFNSIPSIARRAFGLRTSFRGLLRIGSYLAYGSLFRREAFKKQGMLLGAGR